MELAFAVFLTPDLKDARRLFAAKAKIRDLERLDTDSHMAGLVSGRIDTCETSSLHLDVMRDFKRIDAHVVAVACPILSGKANSRLA
jgi:phosphate:Na+ symporter